MTAEIAILNVEAVALAADSAVTVRTDTEFENSRVKIFNSANKLLALSNRHPVGLMVYGNASLMGLPWETIVKQFRGEIGETELPTLSDYATTLFTRLNQLAQHWFPPDLQERHLRSVIADAFEGVRLAVLERVEERLERAATVSESQVVRIGGGVVNEALEFWRNQPDLDVYTESERRRIGTDLGRLVEDVKSEVLEQFPFSDTAHRNLSRIGVLSVTKFRGLRGENSGVVVAGFGRDDMTPCLEAFQVDGIAHDRVRFVRDSEKCARIRHNMRAAVVPFAQSKVAAGFMNGIDPELRHHMHLLRDYLFESAAEEVAKKQERFADSTREKIRRDITEALGQVGGTLDGFLDQAIGSAFSQPIVQTIAHMPRDELARVAETLVDLTSFRQRVTMSDETVGGPIDVAVISKGDGFIWIKRKHYFDPSLNQRFIARLYEGKSENAD